jgi:outer membrane protein OmpA-like peptidoglycan-associated protein
MSPLKIALTVFAALALAACSMTKGPTPTPPSPRMPVVYLLFFHGSSAELTPAAKVIVDQAAAKVRENPPSTVTLAGYTAAVGTPDRQLGMAEQRIRAVEAALVADGVDSKLFLRIPLGDADDNAGATGDRRIEIRLTYDK